MRRVAVLVMLAFIGACGKTPLIHVQSEPSPSASTTPQAPMAHIDWLDFVRFDGISYLAYPVAVGGQLISEELGSRHAVVRRRLSDTVSDPSYRPQDGDAAFLDPGTPVYTVKGFNPAFRLAARREGRIVVYEVDDNPRAVRAAELLDIDGKVRYVSVHSAEDARQLAEVRDRRDVAALVRDAVGGSLDRTRHAAQGDRYFVAFRLADGTAVTRQYLVRFDQLSPGIKVSPEFKSIVLRAVGR